MIPETGTRAEFKHSAWAVIGTEKVVRMLNAVIGRDVPMPPEVRDDGECVARKHGICKQARDCPYLVSGPCVAWCDVCGYDDTYV